MAATLIARVTIFAAAFALPGGFNNIIHAKCLMLCFLKCFFIYINISKQ
jgi:hypothetical protein